VGVVCGGGGEGSSVGSSTIYRRKRRKEGEGRERRKGKRGGKVWQKGSPNLTFKKGKGMKKKKSILPFKQRERKEKKGRDRSCKMIRETLVQRKKKKKKKKRRLAARVYVMQP